MPHLLPKKKIHVPWKGTISTVGKIVFQPSFSGAMLVLGSVVNPLNYGESISMTSFFLPSDYTCWWRGIPKIELLEALSLTFI